MYKKLQCLISQQYYHKLIFKQNGNIFKQCAQYDLLQPPDNLSGNPSKFKAMSAVLNVEKKSTRNTLQSVRKAWKHRESTVFLVSFKNKVNNWIHFFNLKVLYLNRYLKVEVKHIKSTFLKNVTKILFNNKFNS